jgi:hypothetical protein
MATEQPLAPAAAPEVPIWWRVHDVAIGILAGFGVGVIAGLFATRLVETNVIVAVGGAIGAILGAVALWRSRRQDGGFVNAIVVIAWVALGLSAVFLTVLVLAILNFE